MPYSGKSTIGELLSKKLDFDFVDIDRVIELKENTTISEIFKIKGEEYFRYLEALIVKDLNSITNTVVSTGGGTPLFFDNLKKLKLIGIVIYLNAAIDTLVERSKNDSSRPLLKDKSFKELYLSRVDTYNMADIIINANNMDKDKLCDTIIMEILQYKTNNNCK